MLGDDDVYEGLWEKYNQPIFQRWKWTLGNLNGFLVLGCLGILITFTQSRAWVVLRYLVLLRKKSIRLDGDSHSDPLEHLSQTHAIKDIVPFIRHLATWLQHLSRRLFRPTLKGRGIQLHFDSSIISPLFGATALLNAFLFIAMGVAIPCIVSEGTLGAPVVKSRMNNDRCLDEGYLYSYEPPPVADAVFQLCNKYGRAKPGCGEELYLQAPEIRKNRPKACPFPGNICNNNSNPLELTHENITGYEIGINTKSRVMLNHRLTCSPVHLDSFLLHNIGSGHLTNISVKDISFNADGDRRFNNAWQRRYDMTLSTLNGPNGCSSEYSGNPPVWGETLPQDFTILPSLLGDQIYRHGFMSPSPILHPDLRRDDGNSFLIVFRAGGGRFISRNPVDDPFFASHTKCYIQPEHYCPDHEATALGCVEQSQYCRTDSDFCTSWGSGMNEFLKMRNRLEKEKDETSINDIWAFSTTRLSLSVYRHLVARQVSYLVKNNNYRLPLNTVRMRHWGQASDLPIAEDQWITEVETWFRRAILDAILEAQTGPRHRDLLVLFGPDLMRFENETPENSTCDRILFRNANHTNINWVELWLITSLLVLICIASFAIKWLDNITRAICKGLAHFVKFLGKRLILAGKTLNIFIFDWRRRKFFQVLDRVSQWRTWYSRTAQASELMTESSRHEFRGSIRGSDFDDSDLTSVSIALDQLGVS